MNQQAVLAAAARQLAQPGAPALLRCPALEKGGIRVFAAARHEVVSAVLCDEETFSLQQYDELLQQVLPGTRYLVGENDANRQVRLRQLHAAQGWLNARLPGVDPKLPPNLDPGFRGWIAAMAREEASGILDVLQPRARTTETINFVREYAFLLAYRMARRVLGVPAPRTVPWPVPLMLFARNLIKGGPALRRKDELGDALSALFLQVPLFGHVFGTITTSAGMLPWLAGKTASVGLAAIDDAFDMPQVAPETSLLSALVAVEPQFSEVADYRLQARSVLFELTGALVLIVGKVLSEIAAFSASDRGREAGIPWPSLVERLRDPVLEPRARDAIIAEMLRLADTSQLVRRVRHACIWRGEQLKAGDRVVALVGDAAHDEAAFPQAHRFAPDPARPYITSGPLQGPHVCYGRGIAWTIIAEAIAATAGRIEPAPGAKLGTFVNLPDDLRFTAIRQ
ncbi:cytochrome P450 [Novosphingobium jiangmenense]|uniref:Cytochrome P450 n=1 Tax=Novosphingobium jiangmenense TaxID=2791981 RepID=A0ABS0HJH2_9SPHN|nr:cytochrome P450 [Novosphingobium jiangmenense]MBF9152401.1 cytochrome P450 [Novosphingobium jiangmenense]